MQEWEVSKESIAVMKQLSAKLNDMKELLANDSSKLSDIIKENEDGWDLMLRIFLRVLNR